MFGFVQFGDAGQQGVAPIENAGEVVASGLTVAFPVTLENAKTELVPARVNSITATTAILRTFCMARLLELSFGFLWGEFLENTANSHFGTESRKLLTFSEAPENVWL